MYGLRTQVGCVLGWGIIVVWGGEGVVEVLDYGEDGGLCG